MKRTDLRTFCIATAATAVTLSSPVPARSSDISGVVTFESGASIPQGDLEIYLDDPAVGGGMKRRIAEMRVKSDGKSTALDFSLTPPVVSTVSKNPRIVARLERADGWLMARGSTPYKSGSRLKIVLKPVMY